MTQKEMHRAEVIIKVTEKRLTQAQAAEELSLSLRQVQRLCALVRSDGIASLASKKRGKASNRRLPEITRARVSEIITAKIYAGFGPTLMCEKLEELHNIKISCETTRKLMIQNGVWDVNRKKRPVIHQQRQRRARLGELTQVDSSPHAWFEDRGERCNLIVFIDDATGRTYGKFFDSETSAAYMETTCEYINKYGKPLAFYTDKHAAFRINGKSTKRDNFTQLGRALKELDIQLIYANSPQAKGRVERANQTLQDRLIKEMRLRGISTKEEANKFLETFWDKYNERYAVAPRSPENAHRVNTMDLSRILCFKEERTISKNHEFQFENEFYQVKLKKRHRTLARARITVIKKLDGTVIFEYQGKPLPVQKPGEQMASKPELSTKESEPHIYTNRIKYKPPENHPWRTWRGKHHQTSHAA